MTKGGVSLYFYYIGQCSPFFMMFLASAYVADIIPKKHRAAFFAFNSGVFSFTSIWASHVAGFFVPGDPANMTIAEVAEEFHGDILDVTTISVMCQTSGLLLMIFCLPETLPPERRKRVDLKDRAQLLEAFNTLAQLKILKRSKIFQRLAATLFFASMCSMGLFTFQALYLTRELGFMPDNTVILSEVSGCYGLATNFLLTPMIIYR